MVYGSKSLLLNAPIEIALRVTLFSLAVIAALIFFIWARRYYRGRLFARRDSLAFEVRKKWDRIVSLQIAPESWRNKPLERDVIETILLDQIDVASGDELKALLRCYRDSGLLDLRIQQARTSRGWKRQAALAALGRTREPEAISALTEALDAKRTCEITSGVRALGRIGLPEAAEPILERLAERGLPVPPVPLKSALVNCCRTKPELLLKYVGRGEPEVREILARALAEVISPALGDELMVLCQDPSPEVRASVARALGQIQAVFALSLLSTMTMDDVWYVRLRAVTSLALSKDPSCIDIFVRALCDTNRVVRQRAALALTSFPKHAKDILELIIATQDKYALHSYVSELQRSGQYGDLLRILKAKQARPGHEDLIQAVEAAQQDLSMRERPAREPVPEAVK
jgi:HEAT repeat protein